MYGNVWEWVIDKDSLSGVRGGGHHNEADETTSGHHGMLSPDNVSGDIGFRLLRISN